MSNILSKGYKLYYYILIMYKKTEHIDMEVTRKRYVNNLTVIQHLKELRIRLLISMGVVLIAFAVLFAFSEQIIRFITGPITDAGSGLHFLKVHEAFFSTLKASLVAAVVISSPVWIWLITGFILPAFNKKEKSIFIAVLFVSVLFVIGGFFFSYKVLLPLSLKFFLSINQNEFTSVISIEYYLNFFLRLFFATGLGFQLPLILLFLSRMGIITYKSLFKMRKYSILIILLISAIITPPDIISQIILGFPLYFLFELGILLAYIFRIKEELNG